mgnify:CR=1 FL=1
MLYLRFPEGPSRRRLIESWFHVPSNGPFRDTSHLLEP